MNIFVLDENPVKAAFLVDDIRLPKMCLETCQMLATALHKLGVPDRHLPHTLKGTPYRPTHMNHPCTIWAGQSRQNFEWLVRHGIALCREFTRRFGKMHACHTQITLCQHTMDVLDMTGRKGVTNHQTPFALCMPDEYRPAYIHVASSPFDVLTDEGGNKITHATGDLAVAAYREYYQSKQLTSKVEYKRTEKPEWFKIIATKEE
tara:strand:+ start:298 stop:912 length:615 start_codon:yes stop_codon:yes gene_type:complete